MMNIMTIRTRIRIMRIMIITMIMPGDDDQQAHHGGRRARRRPDDALEGNAPDNALEMDHGVSIYNQILP